MAEAKSTTVGRVADILAGKGQAVGKASMSGNVAARAQAPAQRTEGDGGLPRGGQRRQKMMAAPDDDDDGGSDAWDPVPYATDGDQSGADLEENNRRPGAQEGDDGEPGDGAGADGAGDGEGKAEGDGEAGERVTLKELADQLGVRSKDVLDVAVFMGHEDPDNASSPGVYSSIRELRDQVKEFKTFREAHGEVFDARGDLEVERAAAVRQVAVMAQMIEQATGRPVTAAMQEQANGFERERIARERTRLSASLPQWKDNKVREADRDLITRFARQFNFSESEIAGVTDHRIVLMLRRAALDWDRTKQAGGKKVPLDAPRQGARTQGAQRDNKSALRSIINKAKAGTKADKIAAVQALLNR